MTYTLFIYLLIGAVQVSATAGPFPTLADCDKAGAYTRQFSRLYVDKVEATCKRAAN